MDKSGDLPDKGGEQYHEKKSIFTDCGRQPCRVTGGKPALCGSRRGVRRGSYTYHSTTSLINTFSPTDWQLESEGDIIGYTMTALYEFAVNDTYDGYDIIPGAAADYPEDVTADFAGNETYGVPADATEGYAWKVTIRDDMVWDDGTPITVDDLEYTLQQFLNPEMKNYRASLYYSGIAGLANGKAYYSQGSALYTAATTEGFAFADLTEGDDGQYTDPNGNPVYFSWTAGIDNDWMGGYSLSDYSDYFSEEAASGLEGLQNSDGFVPVTQESIDYVYSLTGSDDWGNESQDDLINYMVSSTGVGEAVDWSNVGYIKNDDYTFTVILANPATLFNFEYGFPFYLLKEDLYEASKQDSGGVIKSSYGTSADSFASFGPYKLTEYQESKVVKLEKNENWYGYADDQMEGYYQTTDIELQMIDDHSTQMYMFLQGNLDNVELTSDDMDTYGTSDYVYYTPESFTYSLAINTDYDALKQRQDATPGVNKVIYTYEDFRHALAIGIDRSDYAKSCTSGSEACYGLLNDIYIANPATSESYRDTEAAQKVLCDVYGVSSVDELTGYDSVQASELLQKAYDEAYAAGDINDTDVIEIEYHVRSSSTEYQKMVDYIDASLKAIAAGTSLEGRVSVVLVDDPDFYTNMRSGGCDMIREAPGGSDMDPFSMSQSWTDPDYIMEYGFDSSRDLTITVNGEEITKSFYEWYLALNEGEYAAADYDTRVEVLAGLEEGILLDYHIIPMNNSVTAELYSQRIMFPCDFINTLVGRGGLKLMTYTMDDAEWEQYCADQNNQLTY